MRLVTPTSTWASPRAILAVTERRLLWLLDDAPVARVHSLAFRNVAEIEHRDAAQARDDDDPHAHRPPPRLPRAAPAHCGQDRATACWNDRPASYRGRVRVADPVHNVELRRNTNGHDAVVFAFPYRADIVDAVRAIPGRRFDWQAKEWWAPRVDATAAYVQGVLERFPELDVAPEVTRVARRAVKGWVGRVTTARRAGKGWFVLDGIAGELPEELPRSPRSAATGAGCRSRRRSPRRCSRSWRARGWTSARRAARPSCRSAWIPRPATLMLVESYGESRFKLEVNWDPDTVGAFVELPAAEAHGRTVPIDPYLLEPLEHFIRLHAIDVGAQRARGAGAAAHRARRGDRRRPPLARVGRARRWSASRGWAASCGRSSAPASGTRSSRGGCSSPTSRGWARPIEALALLEEDDAFPAVVICPASLKLNWQREIQHWLPHRSLHVVVGTGKTIPKAEITVLNYEIVHAHRERLAISRPKALILDESHYVKNPAAKRTRAVRRLAEALPEGAFKIALTGTPVMNHPDELIAQLRILGRLEEFGSGARFKRRFQGAGAEERIHWHLRRTCFVRRLKKDVLPQLPEKRQVVVPVALENEREYRLAERDVVAWLQEQPLELSELEAKVQATLRAERLAQLNTLRRLAARGKLGPALAWIDDFLAVRGAAGRLRQPPRDPGDGRPALPGRAARRRRRQGARPRRRRPGVPGPRAARS